MTAAVPPAVTDTENVPPVLAAREQWIGWRNECRDCETVLDPSAKACPHCSTDDEEMPTTKRPLDPSTGRFARVDDPSTWGTYDDAVEFFDTSDAHGIGFAFSEDDDVVGVDIDDCRDPETGEIDDWAVDIVVKLASFVEVSPSGTGLHIYAFGSLPEGGNRKDGVEMYEAERYFTVTGDQIPQSPGSVTYREDELAAVHSGYVDNSLGSGGFDADVDVDLTDVNFREAEETYENDIGETLAEVREQYEELDAALTELEPGYELPGSKTTSEYDLSTVSKLWKRRFSVDQIAKIVYENRYREKVERQDYLELTISAGVGGDRFNPDEYDDVEIIEDREQYASIDEATLPEDSHFVLEKPPREGGSHASIDHLSDKPLAILASRHAICEHHLEILDKVMPDGKTAVHREGSSRACRNGGEDDCPNVVGKDGERPFEAIYAAKNAIADNRIITADDCPDDLCPGQFLKYVEKHCHAVVTVPNLLPDLERNFEGCNLLIDEEQALSYFRPPSVSLATIESVYDPDGTRIVHAPSSNITTQLDTLRDICSQILEDRQERAKDGETNRIHRTPREEDVLHTTDYLKRLSHAMSISDIEDEIDGSPTAGEVASEIRERLSEIPVPEPELDPSTFRDGIEEYVERYYWDDSAAPGDVIECILFGYDDRKFDFKNTPAGHKIRMIGGRDVFHPDLLLQFQQIGVIAGPEGELLLDDLDVDATVVEITEFNYADDFVVLPIGRERDDRMEPVNKQRDRVARVSRILNGRSHPHFAVTGTKQSARSHLSTLTEGGAQIISSPRSPTIDLADAWSTGDTAVIYENSAVSRGIDAPLFDISIAVSTGFATPYWEAKKAHEERGTDEHDRSRAIEMQLKNHELTNAVLRTSPTRTVDDVSGTKFIVCADWDANRIGYLHNQHLQTSSTAETAANFLQNVTVYGDVRREHENVHRQLGGSDSEFIDWRMRNGIKTSATQRPRVSVEDLRSWAEKGYLTDKDERDTIGRQGVPPNREDSTSEIANLFDYARGRVSCSLSLLEKMGIVESREIKDGSGGRPKVLWTR